MNDRNRRIVVGITGASGGIYATRLIALLAEAGVETHVIISTYGRQVIADEPSIENPTAETLAGPHAAPARPSAGSPAPASSFLFS